MVVTDGIPDRVTKVTGGNPAQVALLEVGLCPAIPHLRAERVAFHRYLFILTDETTQEPIMDRKGRILELAKQMGIIRPRDVEAAGIPREYLRRLFQRGELVRVGRGLYALPETVNTESITLAEVAKRVPNAVICLLSALQFQQIDIGFGDVNG